ncbi:hypothetical protein PS783_30770 [Streptomyces enissocaesilis]|nr:Hypothetical protein pFRL5_253 [Streptomyces sp. F8]WDI21712.1 hypothetical protein PS783_30770 [Streptomyces enissocaesilis]
MEYVSLLAGVPFSDSPQCTDELLGAVARAVNDAMSDAARGRLAAFAPALAVTGRLGPGSAGRVEAVCWSVLAHGAPGRGARRRAVRRRDAARDRALACQAGGRWAHWMALHGPRRRAVEAAVVLLARREDADAALEKLLADCLQAALARPVAGPQHTPLRVTV